MNLDGWALIAGVVLASLGTLWAAAELLVPRCAMCGEPIEGNDDEIDRLLNSPDWRVAYLSFHFIPPAYCTRCWRRRRR